MKKEILESMVRDLYYEYNKKNSKLSFSDEDDKLVIYEDKIAKAILKIINKIETKTYCITNYNISEYNVIAVIHPKSIKFNIEEIESLLNDEKHLIFTNGCFHTSIKYNSYQSFPYINDYLSKLKEWGFNHPNLDNNTMIDLILEELTQDFIKNYKPKRFVNFKIRKK